MDFYPPKTTTLGTSQSNWLFNRLHKGRFCFVKEYLRGIYYSILYYLCPPPPLSSNLFHWKPSIIITWSQNTLDIDYSIYFIFSKDPFFSLLLDVVHVLVLVKWFNENNNKGEVGKNWELTWQYKDYTIHVFYKIRIKLILFLLQNLDA